MDDYIAADAAIIIAFVDNGHLERLNVLLWLNVHVLFQFDSLLLRILLSCKWLTST